MQFRQSLPAITIDVYLYCNLLLGGTQCRRCLPTIGIDDYIIRPLSKAKEANIRVPHGSLLSATLFLVFTNDLLNISLHGKVIGFDDVIAIRYS